MGLLSTTKAVATRAAKQARANTFLNRLATDSLKTIIDAAGQPIDLVVNHLPRVGFVKTTLPGGQTMTLWSLGDDFITNQVFWRGWDAFEPETEPVWWELASKARVVLDVGAHVGLFALIAAYANPRSRVFAFEPLPPVFERMQRNLALNDLGNVELIQAAVGDTEGEATLIHGDGIPSSSSLSEKFMGTDPRLHKTVVPVLTLDGYLEARGITEVDLVKIDTESTEPAVLRGMRRTLERCRPDLIIEVLPKQGTLPELESLLGPLGYRGEHLVPRNDRQRSIAAAIAKITGRPDPYDNYLFTAEGPREGHA